jgi:hypothetical protein
MLVTRKRGEIRVVRFIIIPEDQMAFRVVIVIRVQYLSEVGLTLSATEVGSLQL